MSETLHDPHPKTIGNPASWVIQSLQSAGHGTAEAIDELRSEPRAAPRVRPLTLKTCNRRCGPDGTISKRRGRMPCFWCSSIP